MWQPIAVTDLPPGPAVGPDAQSGEVNTRRRIRFAAPLPAGPRDDGLEPFLGEDARPRVVASNYVVRDTVRGPANRVEYETREGFHYTRDEEPEMLADAATGMSRLRGVDRRETQRLARTPASDLHFDPYEVRVPE